VHSFVHFSLWNCISWWYYTHTCTHTKKQIRIVTKDGKKELSSFILTYSLPLWSSKHLDLPCNRCPLFSVICSLLFFCYQLSAISISEWHTLFIFRIDLISNFRWRQCVPRFNSLGYCMYWQEYGVNSASFDIFVLTTAANMKCGSRKQQGYIFCCNV
jgi:hypothetical protein